jgi:hypothetical protein
MVKVREKDKRVRQTQERSGEEKKGREIQRISTPPNRSSQPTNLPFRSQTHQSHLHNFSTIITSSLRFHIHSDNTSHLSSTT